MSEINIKYIRKVLRFIEKGPKKRFEMRTYISYCDPKTHSRQWLKSAGYPACGTQACFAGWAVLMQEKPSRWRSWSIGGHPNSISRRAMELCGFDDNEATYVFAGPACWIMGFDNQLRLLKRSINEVLRDRGMKERVR